MLRKTRREQERLAQGWTREPPTFYERNQRVAPPLENSPSANQCHYVTPRIEPQISKGSLPPKPLLVTIQGAPETPQQA